MARRRVETQHPASSREGKFVFSVPKPSKRVDATCRERCFALASIGCGLPLGIVGSGLALACFPAKRGFGL